MHWIDPQALLETAGSVSRFVYDAKGDADGFLLDGGLQVHLPPHLSSELLEQVKVSDAVRVRGVKPRGADLVAAVSLTTAKEGEILDHGPDVARPQRPAPPRTARPVELRGQVEQTLYAPKGEVYGALLTSGEMLRMRPKENAALAPYFAVGARIAVWGDAIVVKGQKVIDLADVAFDT